ncbi:MAG: outer membrane lipoprotein carrier protein LolA, partial [Myxococcota bacterium]
MRYGAASKVSVLLFASFFLGTPAEGQDETLSLDRLLEGFSEMPGLSARFREEKRIALLAVPLRSEGEIHFAPPGKLLRRVNQPTESAALIEGDTLTLVSGGREER